MLINIFKLFHFHAELLKLYWKCLLLSILLVRWSMINRDRNLIASYHRQCYSSLLRYTVDWEDTKRKMTNSIYGHSRTKRDVREKTIIQRVSKISVYLARLFVKPTRQRDTTGNGATPLTKEEHPGSYAIAKISTITKSHTISYHFYFDPIFVPTLIPNTHRLKIWRNILDILVINVKILKRTSYRSLSK